MYFCINLGSRSFIHVLKFVITFAIELLTYSMCLQYFFYQVIIYVRRKLLHCPVEIHVHCTLSRCSQTRQCLKFVGVVTVAEALTQAIAVSLGEKRNICHV